ncbi:MAG TPA: efflux RND transporter periplasmic adaptor subunit [Rudaea sp.]|nr:efflux RND transporter periplasmic adaptor subunit [Rudaea sp.]
MSIAAPAKTTWKVAALGVAVVLLAACGRPPEAPKPASPPPLATIVVASTDAAAAQAWDGIVEAVNETTLAAQTNARVLELPVDVGDRVSKGQVLVRFTDVEQSSGRRSAEGAVAAAKASLVQVEANYKRIADIYARQLVARADLDAATAQRDAARAALASAQAQLRSAGQQADYTVVRAPFDGVVTQRFVEIGQAVQSGPPQPQPLLALAALDALRAEVTVPQGAAEAIRAHAQATLLLDGGARRVPAASVAVLPTADPATHTFRVRVGVPAGTVGLWPGMTVKIAFAIGDAQRLLVPHTALVQRGEIDGVYVVGADNSVGLRQLRLGHRDGEDVEVLSGLAAGERVARDPVAAARWLVALHAGKATP